MVLFGRDISGTVVRSEISFSPQKINKESLIRGYSLKVMQYAAAQRDEEKRQLYWFLVFDLRIRPEHLYLLR